MNISTHIQDSPAWCLDDFVNEFDVAKLPRHCRVQEIMLSPRRKQGYGGFQIMGGSWSPVSNVEGNEIFWRGN